LTETGRLYSQFLQAVVIDAEMVSDFVPDHTLNLAADFFFCAAPELDGFLEDRDFIREYHTVVTAPPGLRHAFIKPQKDRPGRYPALLHLRGGGVIVDEDIDIIQPVEELLWQVIDGAGYQLFETFAFHHVHYRVETLLDATRWRWYYHGRQLEMENTDDIC